MLLSHYIYTSILNITLYFLGSLNSADGEAFKSSKHCRPQLIEQLTVISNTYLYVDM